MGVATWEDASKMKKDLGIHFCGGYDVRHLIRKHPKAESLSTRSGLAGGNTHIFDYIQIVIIHGLLMGQGYRNSF